MLYYIFEYLDKQFNLPGAGLFQYITFRSGMAMLLSLVISLIFGGRIIRSLKRLQVGETVRELGLEGQKEKEGTPTMGGFIIILAIVIPCLLFARLNNIYIVTMLISTVWLMLIGFADDYIKVFKKNKEGLKSTTKIIGQVVLGVFVGMIMLWHEGITVRMTLDEAKTGGYEVVKQYSTIMPAVNAAPQRVEMAYVKTTLTNVPFFKDNSFDYKSLVSFMGATVLAIMAYVSGNTIIADYLNIFYIPDTAELVIFAACFLGGCIGFLWHNSYPAKVFMGDTGSLTIGGIIAVMALLLRKELLIPILCGIFLVENLSVMLQVSYFKYTKKKYGEGRRILKMSPLHHHFQKEGMHEAKIAVRFWIIGTVLGLLTIITLKVR
ncbi:MAG: phospho-N-acetylmuramoyl-pentapeptide-transferase [Saprospiraceae bacterium]|nr:phospho-N-acetylmuramoyl-pentapeptide-transferase [Saprospiraceae bacterium]